MIDLDKLDEWILSAQLRSVNHMDVTVDPETADFANMAPGIYRVDDKTMYFNPPRPYWRTK
jgi:hypothetical protein